MRIPLLCTMIFLTACQALPSLPEWKSTEGLDHPDVGHVVDLRTDQRISARTLVGRLAAADHVLVGERHDNPDHHALQLWLLRALAERRPPGSILMEMIEPHQQPRVTKVQRLVLKGVQPDDLPAALGWQSGWPWAMYGPLVEYSLAQPAALLHANLDRDEIRKIYQQPPRLNGPAADPLVQKALLEQIRVSHCNMLPESTLPAMLAVQQQRDLRMARQLIAAPVPSVLFAGAFHVRRDLGVPQHHPELARPYGTRVLMLAEVGEPVTSAQADYVWFTPGPRQQDHCASHGSAGGR